MNNFQVIISAISVLVSQSTIITASHCSPCGLLPGISLPSLPSLNLNLGGQKCDEQEVEHDYDRLYEYEHHSPSYPSYDYEQYSHPVSSTPSISVLPVPSPPPVQIPPPSCGSESITFPNIIVALLPPSPSKPAHKKTTHRLPPPPPPSSPPPQPCRPPPITVPVPFPQPYPVPTYESGSDECGC